MNDKMDELLWKAYNLDASDLHLTAGAVPAFRVNGSLQTYGDAPVSLDEMEFMAKRIMTADQWDEFDRKRELDFSYSLQDGARYRVNVYHQRNGISLAARVIPAHIPTLEELNMPSVLVDLAEKPHGLVLVTGPTGSGKSTTLASMIDYINRLKARHIITLEDPIEYDHTDRLSIIHQREIGIDTLSFADGLRAALRQDPDIILVGEMRDLETISTAITAAETGHLVLATLHTNSAAATINRIIDVFPPHQQDQIRIQLAYVLEGIVSQRLFVKRDGTGRLAATEILINHPSIANLIRNEKVEQIQNVLQTSRALGMHTLEASILDMLSKGLIAEDSARPYLSRAGDL